MIGPIPEAHREALEGFLRESVGVAGLDLGGVELPAGSRGARVPLGAAPAGPGGSLAARLVLEVAGDDRVGTESDRVGTESDRVALIEAVRIAGVAAPEPLCACEDPGLIGREFHLVRVPEGASPPAPDDVLVGALDAALACGRCAPPVQPGDTGV